MTAQGNDKASNKASNMQPWILLIPFGLAVAMCASAVCTLVLQQKAEHGMRAMLAYQKECRLSAETWKQQADSLKAEGNNVKRQEENWKLQAQNLKEQLQHWRWQAEKWRQHALSVSEELNGDHKDAAWLRSQWHRDIETAGKQPYAEVTGEPAFHPPVRYGTIPEKTIWLYWYHPQTCPSSLTCVLSPKQQLLHDSIIHNRGSFHVELVHKDQVANFVSKVELPFRWQELTPKLQQGAVMNALLARYGGVALDLCICLLRPLDAYWNEMVANGASFRGYLYRLNGQPWRRAEAVADWFLMSRREGIFSSAVRSQVITMGDGVDPGSYGNWRNAFGDSVLFPILSMFNYSLPRCGDDASVSDHDKCPDAGQIKWWTGISGPARNDSRLLLRDPRDGPLLPFAWLGMDDWSVTGGTMPEHKPDSYGWQTTSGASMFGVSCKTPAECWHEYVMKRLEEKPGPGEAPVLSFVKLTQCDEPQTQSREDLIAAKDSYFFNMLRLAGVATTA